MSRDKEKDKKKGFWKTLFRPKNSPSPTAPLSRKKSGTVTVSSTNPSQRPKA